MIETQPTIHKYTFAKNQVQKAGFYSFSEYVADGYCVCKKLMAVDEDGGEFVQSLSKADAIADTGNFC